ERERDREKVHSKWVKMSREERVGRGRERGREIEIEKLHRKQMSVQHPQIDGQMAPPTKPTVQHQSVCVCVCVCVCVMGGVERGVARGETQARADSLCVCVSLC